MAGVLVPKRDTKSKQVANQWYSPEFNQNISANKAPSQSVKTESRPVFSLSGILGLNQTIELHSEPTKKPENNIIFTNHLEQETKVLFDTHQKELQKEIDALRQEIKNLLKSAGTLDQQVEKAALTPIHEFNTYQLTFLDRLRQLIVAFRRNITEASSWLHVLNKRKSRKNAFWGQVKNKKGGGEQYLFSNEHSAARSGT